MTEQQINKLVEGCRSGERSSQERLYAHFHNYALTVCSRYAASSDEAKEVLNDAFFKIFTKIDRYNPDYSFKGWLHRIVVNTAIDRYRSQQNHPRHEELSYASGVEVETEVIEKLTQEEIFKMVAHLSPAYRTVFNMFVVDGFSHAEIAEKLGITEGASKSNLSKARMQLKRMLMTQDNESGRRMHG
ncbi:MAG: RNA polymerase sigma factor [Saprospiraceae bacterium]|nr:RNA polymerase sigma factor [Saprospiraceae bacterium]